MKKSDSASQDSKLADQHVETKEKEKCQHFSIRYACSLVYFSYPIIYIVFFILIYYTKPFFVIILKKLLCHETSTL